MKRKNTRVARLFFLVALMLIAGFTLLRLVPAAPRLEQCARKVYTFTADNNNFLGWQSNHSFVSTSYIYTITHQSAAGNRYYLHDLDTGQDQQIANTGPNFFRVLRRIHQPLIEVQHLPGDHSFLNIYALKPAPVKTRPSFALQHHIPLQPGLGLKQLWPMAGFDGKEHIVFADIIQQTPSPLERLWKRYITHAPVYKSDFVRLWICHKDGSRLRMIGEGPLTGSMTSASHSTIFYSLQRCQLSQDEKTLYFVWSDGIWSVPVDE